FIEPRNSSSSLVRISAGAFQLLVGPASSSRVEQMKVRSSTRATSLGSVWAQYEPGRRAGSSSVKVAASTSCLHSSACCSPEPSDEWIATGWQSSTIAATQARSRALRVGACTSDTLRLRKFGVPKTVSAPFAVPRTGTGSDLGGREPHVDLGAEAHP